MKKIFFLVFLLFFLTEKYSNGAVVPQVVHDEAANIKLNTLYANSVEQIEKWTSALQQGKDKIRKLGDIGTEMSRMNAEIEKVYNNTFGIVGSLLRLEAEIKSTPKFLDKEMKKFARWGDCQFESYDEMQKVESLYKAHFYHDAFEQDINDFPHRYEVKTCGNVGSFYEEKSLEIKREKEMIIHLLKYLNKTEEEAREDMKFYKEMSNRIKNLKSEKEALVSIATILWRMDSTLSHIDQMMSKTLLDTYWKKHKPNYYKNAGHISREEYNKRKASGQKMDGKDGIRRLRAYNKRKRAELEAKGVYLMPEIRLSKKRKEGRRKSYFDLEEVWKPEDDYEDLDDEY